MISSVSGRYQLPDVMLAYTYQYGSCVVAVAGDSRQIRSAGGGESCFDLLKSTHLTSQPVPILQILGKFNRDGSEEHIRILSLGSGSMQAGTQNSQLASLESHFRMNAVTPRPLLTYHT